MTNLQVAQALKGRRIGSVIRLRLDRGVGPFRAVGVIFSRYQGVHARMRNDVNLGREFSVNITAAGSASIEGRKIKIVEVS